MANHDCIRDWDWDCAMSTLLQDTLAGLEVPVQFCTDAWRTDPGYAELLEWRDVRVPALLRALAVPAGGWDEGTWEAIAARVCAFIPFPVDEDEGEGEGEDWITAQSAALAAAVVGRIPQPRGVGAALLGGYVRALFSGPNLGTRRVGEDGRVRQVAGAEMLVGPRMGGYADACEEEGWKRVVGCELVYAWAMVHYVGEWEWDMGLVVPPLVALLEDHVPRLRRVGARVAQHLVRAGGRGRLEATGVAGVLERALCASLTLPPARDAAFDALLALRTDPASLFHDAILPAWALGHPPTATRWFLALAPRLGPQLTRFTATALDILIATRLPLANDSELPLILHATHAILDSALSTTTLLSLSPALVAAIAKTLVNRDHHAPLLAALLARLATAHPQITRDAQRIISLDPHRFAKLLPQTQTTRSPSPSRSDSDSG